MVLLDGECEGKSGPTRALNADQTPTGARAGCSFYRTRGKRAFDLALGSAMLIAASPLIAFLAILVALDGGQPIFGQVRLGQGGKKFKCYKIRTMRPDAEEQLKSILATDPLAAAEWAVSSKLASDPRVTRLGAFLRKSSLDELPQLVNVFRGEMSLVGPRPVIAEEIPRYGSAAASYFEMRPGLTGPWQVNGRNDISYDGRVALDVAYARNCSFPRDVAIVARTGIAIFRLTGR